MPQEGNSLVCDTLAASVAAVGAVTFTNPIEVVKTRMALQGELVKSKNLKAKSYTNPVQALISIGKNEGLKGVQKGLVVAYPYQILLNCCRLGYYEPTRQFLNNFFHPNEDPRIYQNMYINVFTGSMTGALGAAVSSPLYLVKTRMQSYASHSSKTAVGQQTHYTNFVQGLQQIYKTEGGINGLFRGCDTAMIRTAAGSAIQLPLYNYCKGIIKTNFGYSDDDTRLHLISSTITGFGVGFAINPFDVILTRVYNQRGNLYSGPVDCLMKTVKTEGPRALFKGLGASLMRFAPHSILTLTFMEMASIWIYGARDTYFR
ncbi:Oac1 protein [Saccharomycopsis crataegensis]|uniref:Oac1 protein n=1 Tax=Saccharomycopsis crataegensis TaxID=43959 RepID=A0AAV5QUE3_9ASCO|nr:Oac1 protein [Saccharomycopsis crataegensis]